VTSQYGTQVATTPYKATTPAQTYGSPSNLPTTLYTGPAEKITDGDLYQKGARARGMIKGTQGQAEELDAGKYKKPIFVPGTGLLS
jgi:hypothetical protein